MVDYRKEHNFLLKEGKDGSIQDLELLSRYRNYLENYKDDPKKPQKVSLLLISVNPNYWQFSAQLVSDVGNYFLPGHNTDIFLWTDAPKLTEKDIEEKTQKLFSIQDSKGNKEEKYFELITCYLDTLFLGKPVDEKQFINIMRRFSIEAKVIPTPQETKIMLNNVLPNTEDILRKETLRQLSLLRSMYQKVKIVPIEPIEWPLGTLLRYSTFLQQEEKLKEYDYLFYMDIDMRIVNIVGDEIMGNGLTMVEHPMYALRKEYIPPYEPNRNSTAYIPRFGKILNENGKPRFKPLYAAGGFQGGKAEQFIQAMKVMKKNIDTDFQNNYIAIWNDESHWNKYLFDYKGDLTVLSPSYCYPDSLIDEYYKKLWGRNYNPRIMTLTKAFTLEPVDFSKFSTL